MLSERAGKHGGGGGEGGEKQKKWGHVGQVAGQQLLGCGRLADEQVREEKELLLRQEERGSKIGGAEVS